MLVVLVVTVAAIVLFVCFCYVYDDESTVVIMLSLFFVIITVNNNKNNNAGSNSFGCKSNHFICVFMLRFMLCCFLSHLACLYFDRWQVVDEVKYGSISQKAHQVQSHAASVQPL